MLEDGVCEADLGVTMLFTRVIVPREVLTRTFGCLERSPGLFCSLGAGRGDGSFVLSDFFGCSTRCGKFFPFLLREKLLARDGWLAVKDAAGDGGSVVASGERGLPPTLRDRLERGIELVGLFVKNVGIVGEMGEDKER